MNYDNLPNNIYYDANIVNNDQEDKDNPPQLVFQDIRSTPIITFPELYELSVVRFNLETAHSLPIWIPAIDLRNGYTDRTTYSFTLNYIYDGQTYTSEQRFVHYIPNDFSLPTPQPKTNEDVYNTPYYYVKSFGAIVEMFNNCLLHAFNRLQINANYLGVQLPTTNPPFFEWDSESSKFILNGDVIGFDGKQINHIEIYCNTALYNLMSGFQADYYGQKVTEGKNYKFKLIKETRGLNLFIINDNQYSVIQLYQEYSSASLFTPISSIVFTTSLIPVLPSNSSKPTIFNGRGSLVNSGNNNNITSMITDFESQENNGYGFCGTLSYIPTAEYRFISLNQGSNHQINNIDLIVYWKDNYSNLHPVYLYSGMSCNIKILFRKIKNI